MADQCRYFEKSAPAYSYFETASNLTVGADGGQYNRNGRGLPDVSAIADHISMFAFAREIPDGSGTSASKLTDIYSIFRKKCAHYMP